MVRVCLLRLGLVIAALSGFQLLNVRVQADTVYLNASSTVLSQLEIASAPGIAFISLSFRTCEFSSIVLYQTGTQANTYILLTISSGRLAAQYNTGGGVREVVSVRICM